MIIEIDFGDKCSLETMFEEDFSKNMKQKEQGLDLEGFRM